MAKRLRHLDLTAVYRKVAEGYIGFIEELPGANTQGRTVEEARANLREAAQLGLEANRISPCKTLTRTASFASPFGSLRSEASGAGPTSRAAWLPFATRGLNPEQRKLTTIPRHREINDYPSQEDLPRPRRAGTLTKGRARAPGYPFSRIRRSFSRRQSRSLIEARLS